MISVIIRHLEKGQIPMTTALSVPKKKTVSEEACNTMQRRMSQQTIPNLPQETCPRQNVFKQLDRSHKLDPELIGTIPMAPDRLVVHRKKNVALEF